ncbi:hypothetical protein [Paracoccus marinaquae]|uniref:Uncharacterized protein n=1 Tax=Paracoccus marinaquae TaxID=2841926 RepID=A0ABS6AF70_9RHOB|nr:hypothetical protein [Paracoccus marinaquae]MBU3029233.1 hypothetical protein [Paracoccus marinaquae]
MHSSDDHRQGPAGTDQRQDAGGNRRPETSPTGQAIIWGGVALGVAGLTAAAMLTARRLAGAGDVSRLQADRAADDTPQARRFARPEPTPRHAPRERARRDPRDAPRRNPAQDLTETADALSGSLNNAVDTFVGAFAAFRGIASQVPWIIDEFSAAADQVRTILNKREAPSDDGADGASRKDERRMHRL